MSPDRPCSHCPGQTDAGIDITLGEFLLPLLGFGALSFAGVGFPALMLRRVSDVPVE
ncbi:MAG: hypothetical protein ACM3S1_08190 [Hyphomicrobiales bacterium]